MQARAREHRHQTILRLVREREVRSQGELRELLAADDLAVNQATLSRDLRELGLVKGPSGYAVPDSTPIATDANARATQAVAQWLVEAIPVRNQVVLKTPPGGAQPLALALDHAMPDGAVATLAGDDTVLVICHTDAAARKIARALTATHNGRAHR